MAAHDTGDPTPATHSESSLSSLARTIAGAGGESQVDLNAADADSNRTALHKAAFWGHLHVIDYLTRTCLCNTDVIDFAGDTALHDAARFGHHGIVKELLAVGADSGIVNKEGHTALSLAKLHGKPDVVALIEEHVRAELASVAQARRQSFMMGGAPVSIGATKR